MQQLWYIKYRFYDPAYIHPKQVVIKEGINLEFPWRKHVALVHQLISDEKTRLQNGYTFMPDEVQMKLSGALELALLNAQMAHNTQLYMKSTLKYFGEAMDRLKLDKLSVMHTSRKHVRLILDECYKNTRFAHNTFNHYRK